MVHRGLLEVSDEAVEQLRPHEVEAAQEGRHRHLHAHRACRLGAQDGRLDGWQAGCKRVAGWVRKMAGWMQRVAGGRVDAKGSRLDAEGGSGWRCATCASCTAARVAGPASKKDMQTMRCMRSFSA